MDPVESWIDAEAVRRMAARLLTPAEAAEVRDTPDAGFGPGFVGFAIDLHPRPTIPQPQPQPPVTAAPPPPPAAPPPPPAPEIETPPPPVPKAPRFPMPIDPDELDAELETPAVREEAAEIEEIGEIEETPVGLDGVDAEVAEVAPSPETAEAPADDEVGLAGAAEEFDAVEPEVAKPFMPAAEAEPAASPLEDEMDRPETDEGEVDESARDDEAMEEVVTDEDEPTGPREHLLHRMGEFRDWLIREADARGVFILDRDGNPILDDPPYAKLHFLARSLAQAYRPTVGKVGNVHVKVGTDSYLSVVPVETAFGWMVMGAVLTHPLDAAAVEAVAEVLSQAAQP